MQDPATSSTTQPANDSAAPSAERGEGDAWRLLSRLRDVMADSGTAQERLDRIVAMIAAELGADVCSIYIMRAGEVLELFATVGLRSEAVHQTRLRVGEGLVGATAASTRPLAVDDAPSHPNFVYRPETGEDPYHSLLGVPIVRGGRVRGVLVLQYSERRDFSRVEVETLETVAMVVAELVCSGELIAREEIASAADPGDNEATPSRLEGVCINEGLAMGQAVRHLPQVPVGRMVADDPQAEVARLQTGLQELVASLDDLLARTGQPGSESREVLEAYRMFAEDKGWRKRMEDAVRTGLTAEAAVQQVQADTRLRMSQIADPYLRERLNDLEDLANRLIKHLAGEAVERADLPEAVILVARHMGPAELLDYNQARLRGLVLEEGAPTSHVAVVARALDIPVVGRCRDALSRVDDGDRVMVDGNNAQVFIRPGEQTRAEFAEGMRVRAVQRSRYAALVDRPAQSKCGTPLSLSINAGLLLDVPNVHEVGADGIGLYRTEIPFMVRSAFPTVAAQRDLYSRVYEAAGDKPVVFRTLDVGGDKLLGPGSAGGRDNSPLGWRAIRIGLDRPQLLRRQVRALIEAADGRDLQIMLPLVAELDEFRRARALIERELARAAGHGIRPASHAVGVMLEVPALLFQLDELAREADFLAVGSNDLLQFLFAADRSDPGVGDRYDPLAPAFLRALGRVVAAGAEHGTPVSVCGEMAGRPVEAMALLGLGFRHLSMAVPAIGPVKLMAASLELDSLNEYLDLVIRKSQHSIREKLRGFARDHSLSI